MTDFDKMKQAFQETVNNVPEVELSPNFKDDVMIKVRSMAQLEQFSIVSLIWRYAFVTTFASLVLISTAIFSDKTYDADMAMAIVTDPSALVTIGLLGF